MKKILLSLIVPAMLVGCAKEYMTTVPEQNKAEMELSAVVEENGDGTKTMLGEGNVVKWVKESGVHEDAVSVLSKTEQANNDKFRISSVSGEGTSATFKGALTEGADVYYALFPQSDDASFDGSTITFKMPQEQNYVHGSFGYDCNPSVGAFTYETSSDIQFKNICGAFKISLTGTQKVGKIALQDVFGSNIWGTVKLTADENIGTATQTIDIVDGSNTIYLNCGEGVQLSDTPTAFYFVVPAGAINHGFNVYVYDMEENIIGVIDTRKDNKITRNIIKNMGSQPVAAPADYDLSKYGTANCYIVNAAGSYTFKATKGNEETVIEGIDHVGVLWETKNSHSTVPIYGDIITQVNYSSADDKISFEAKGIKGNALIAAYNSEDKILWSWHIWSRLKPLEVKKYTSGNRPKMMRENIGSIFVNTNGAYGSGFLYQWGRKDPLSASCSRMTNNYFPLCCSESNSSFTIPTNTVSSDGSIGTMEYAVEHPTEFICSSTVDWMNVSDSSLWGADKTENDPCPFGYRVPGKDDLNGIVVSGTLDKYFNIVDNTEIVPFAGRLSNTNPATILPEGYYGLTGYWWTTTASDTNRSFYWLTTESQLNPNWQTDGGRVTGRSVRCIVDEDAFPATIGGSTE